jgi:hypothetical protein
MRGDQDDRRMNTGMRLLKPTVAALDAAGERMGGKSRAFVVEVLVALYAHKLGAETAVPVGLVPGDSRAKKQPRSGTKGGAK